MAAPSSKRVSKHREALRAQGLRPVQIWVPDSRSPAFLEQARKDSDRAAEMDAEDADLQAFMDAVLADLYRSEE
jgi:hypothetical protein